MVNWVGTEQCAIQVTPQATTTTEFHVVNLSTDSASGQWVIIAASRCKIAARGFHANY
jgi:hypothetical protein